MLYSRAMKKHACVWVLGAMATVVAAAQAPAPAATYKTEAQLITALAAGAATPDMLTSAVSNGDHHRNGG